MSQTKVNLNTINKEVISLKNEVRSLRFLVGSIVGRDQEGIYKPEFVEEILKAAKEQPDYVEQ